MVLIMTTEVIPTELCTPENDENWTSYRLMVNSIKDYAIFMLDTEGYIKTWNPGAEQLKGYVAEEIIGKHFSLFYTEKAIQAGHPDSELQSAQKQGCFEDEGWRVRKDGSKFWASVLITTIYNDTKQLVGFSKVTRDLTERKKAEESVKELKDVKFALNQSTIVAITNKQGIITYVNEAFCKISKYSEQELLGQNHRIINSGHHSHQFFIDMWKTIASGSVWKNEIKNRAKDGTYYWVDTTIVPFLDAHGKSYQYIAIRHDITERKRVEEELRNSLKDVTDIKFALDQSTIVAITNKQGIITYVNEAFCKISKYSEQELLGQNHRIINSGHHPHQFFIDMWKTIASGSVWKNEIKNRAKDGTYYWVDTTIVPFLDANGKSYQYIAIRHDITERKRIEEENLKLTNELEKRVIERTTQLAQLEAMNKELESFSYSVSHDLRAPLRSIDGFSNLLLRGYSDALDKKGQEYLQFIRSDSQRMAQLIDELLNLSRLTRGDLNRQAVNLTDQAKNIVQTLQKQEPNRSIEFVTVEELEANGDEHLLRAVLENLLGNAWKFTSKINNPRIEFGITTIANKPTYFVRDNGAGFEMDYADKMFGAFQRLHKMEEFPGTGIGLATVQRIIHRHGGEVWAEGKINQGATFYFTLA
jgi:PAS domain S-box-containing protein